MNTPETPRLTVDIVIESEDHPGEIVLIERRNPPHGLALPGGFVDVGETVEAAAVREAQEETSLDVRLRALLGVYSDPHRDPRGHTASVVFVATARGEAKAADDAKSIRMIRSDRSDMNLVFDHARILRDYRRFLAGHNPLMLE